MLPNAQDMLQMCSFDASKSTKGASKLRRDLINAEIANLRDLLPLPSSTRQRLSQLQLMALVCVYVRKANYFQQVFRKYDPGDQMTPTFGFSKALSGFIMMTTQNGKLLYISDNAAEYLGHSMEDLLIHGDSVYDIIDKQDHQSVQTELLRGGATGPADDQRMFLCRMNVSRNARRQMRFGDQKVVLVQGHFLSFLPLCSRNEPVFLSTCTPVAMPETRECVVQGSTNIFTSIHAMDMKFVSLDKKGKLSEGRKYNGEQISRDMIFGEFYLGYNKESIQGTSWYQLIHWDNIKEAQTKHKMITQADQDRACIMLLRLQHQLGPWLWVHVVLQVKDNMEGSQHPVIVCTNQVLSDREALVMRANGWLYHYYTVQSKLQYSLALEGHAPRVPGYYPSVMPTYPHLPPEAQQHHLPPPPPLLLHHPQPQHPHGTHYHPHHHHHHQQQQSPHNGSTRLATAGSAPASTAWSPPASSFREDDFGDGAGGGDGATVALSGGGIAQLTQHGSVRLRRKGRQLGTVLDLAATGTDETEEEEGQQNPSPSSSEPQTVPDLGSYHRSGSHHQHHPTGSGTPAGHRRREMSEQYVPEGSRTAVKMEVERLCAESVPASSPDSSSYAGWSPPVGPATREVANSFGVGNVSKRRRACSRSPSPGAGPPLPVVAASPWSMPVDGARLSHETVGWPTCTCNANTCSPLCLCAKLFDGGQRAPQSHDWQFCCTTAAYEQHARHWVNSRHAHPTALVSASASSIGGTTFAPLRVKSDSDSNSSSPGGETVNSSSQWPTGTRSMQMDDSVIGDEWFFEYHTHHDGGGLQSRQYARRCQRHAVPGCTEQKCRNG